MHSLRFIAVLDDCNDSKEAGNDRVQKEGEGGSEGERKRGREKEMKGKDRRKAKEGERKRKKGRRGGSEEERTLLASVVHVARALYMNVTQDVAVGLSCILCTPTLDYTEYYARLRSIIQNTMHAYAR